MTLLNRNPIASFCRSVVGLNIIPLFVECYIANAVGFSARYLYLCFLFTPQSTLSSTQKPLQNSIIMHNPKTTIKVTLNRCSKCWMFYIPWLEGPFYRTFLCPAIDAIPIHALVGTGCVANWESLLLAPTQSDKVDVALAHYALAEKIYAVVGMHQIVFKLFSREVGEVIILIHIPQQAFLKGENVNFYSMF
jgi:hypothetical protein